MLLLPLSCFSHVQLFATPVDCSPLDSSVNGIIQAGILEWVVCPSPGDLPDPGIKPVSPALQADSLPLNIWRGPITETIWEYK